MPSPSITAMRSFFTNNSLKPAALKGCATHSTCYVLRAMCYVLVLHAGGREAAVLGEPAAVGVDDRAGNEAGSVGGKEECRADHLLRLPPPVERALGGVGLEPLL